MVRRFGWRGRIRQEIPTERLAVGCQLIPVWIRLEEPKGNAQVLFEAHKIRVAEGAYNIQDSHLADAIGLLTSRNQGSLSDDLEAKHAYPEPVSGP